MLNNLQANGVWDVQNIIDAHLAKERDHKSSGKLWASDIGNCRRRAMLRINRVLPSNSEADYMNDVEWVRVTAAYGNIVEENLTKPALVDILQNDLGIRVDWNPSIKGLTKHWSGRPDFIIGHGSKDVQIVEHKVTGGDHKPKRWKIPSDYFPQPKHVGQLALYGYVYEKAFGIKPQLILFYRTYKNVAQFRIEISAFETRAIGHINREPVDKLVDIDPMHIIANYEALFEAQEVPPVHEPNSKGYATQCHFFGRPNCPYYDICHRRAEMTYKPKPTNQEPAESSPLLGGVATVEEDVKVDNFESGSVVSSDDILDAAFYGDPEKKRQTVDLDVNWVSDDDVPTQGDFENLDDIPF